MWSAWVIELSVYISNSQAKSRAIQGQKKQAFFGFFKWHDAHISCAGFNLKYLCTKKCDGSVPIYPIPPKILPWGSMAGVFNLSARAKVPLKLMSGIYLLIGNKCAFLCAFANSSQCNIYHFMQGGRTCVKAQRAFAENFGLGHKF